MNIENDLNTMENPVLKQNGFLKAVKYIKYFTVIYSLLKEVFIIYLAIKFLW